MVFSFCVVTNRHQIVAHDYDKHISCRATSRC
jgi:hypothetical protein